MKKSFYLWLPLAFIVGGLVGAWGPSEELGAFKRRSENKEKSEKKTRRFDDFAKMMNIPDVAKRRRYARSSTTNAVAANVPAATRSQQSPKEFSVGEDEHAKAASERLNPEDLRARIEEASELWRTRSELVLSNTVRKLKLDADGEARFEEVLVRMNEDIRSSVQAIADALAGEEELTPELAVRLMGEFSTTLAETYDRLGECAAEKFRGEVSKLNLTDFVDPSVAEPLISVQHKLNEFSVRRSRR